MTAPTATTAASAWSIESAGVYRHDSVDGEGRGPSLPAPGVGRAIPPAALLATFPGEPIEADWASPVDPRGCGDVWPDLSRCQHGKRPARFPIAYAWAMLRRGGVWSYQGEAFASSMRGEMAIACIIQALTKQLSQGRTPVLVVPPDVQGAALDALEGALATRVGRCELVSRPVAAAAAWALTTNRAPQRAVPVAGHRTAVLALHLGLTQWDARLVHVRASHEGVAEIDLVESDWPEAPGSYGLDLLGRLAARSLEMSYRQPSATRIWELMWCTPWLRIVVELLRGGQAEAGDARPALSAHALSLEFLRQQWRQATQQILAGGPGATACVVEDLPPSPRLEDLRDWVSALRDRAAKHEITVAVVTGAMAAVIDRDLGVFGEHYARRLVPQVNQIAIEGRDLPRGCLAAGAAALFG